ncbi:acyl-CoA thioesterase [Paenarthrobacter sp. NPDC018779]|uniref:acyl-CoA thioesterase n=1 Tax=Paenarthrobacter sp. NPDC018779 TaxID=3364375 RepID=UPI0037C51D9B
MPEASVQRTVEWVDTDASGHQHNSAILRWVEAAEAELFRALELPDYFPSAPRVQQIINYKAKLWFGQRVTASVRVQALGRTSLTLEFEVRGHPLPTPAGTPDGGTPDAGTLDAGTPDAGTPDPGTLDAGTPDAGTPPAAVVAAYGTVTTAHVPAGSATAQPWPPHMVQALTPDALSPNTP